MDIMIYRDGMTARVGLGRDHKWTKKGLLVSGGPYPLTVMTGRGVFAEVLDEHDEVVSEGGDGEFLYVDSTKDKRLVRRKVLKPVVLTAAELNKARQKTQVSVVDQQQYDSGLIDFGASYTDGTLARVIKSFQRALAKIPAQYRAKARCEIDSKGGYEGSHYAYVEINYDRPETDEEVVERVTIGRERERLGKLRKQAQLAALQKELAAQ